MTTLLTKPPVLATKHPFLMDMRKEHVQSLLDGATEQQFDPDEIIFREGEPANKFYLIESGEIALESHCPGNGNVQIQTLHGGDVLGWSWLFPPFAWNFQARAVKSSRLICCNGAHILVTSEDDDRFGHELMKRISRITIRRLQAARKQLVQVQSILAGTSALSKK